MRKALAMLVVFAVVALGACKDKGEEKEGLAGKEPCAAAPAALSGSSGLPSGFPVPAGVVITGTRAAGPSTVVTGYAQSTIKAVFDQFKSALDKAPYSVTKSEREEHDAEVNFKGGGSDGQVRLGQECQGRVSVTITARPT
jgi:hypothetical protein